MKTKWTYSLVSCVLAGILALAGCSDSGPRPQIIRTEPTLVLPDRLLVQRRVVGRSVQNRPIECIALGQGHDVTLILATIHGNEPAGTPLVERLAEHLKQNPDLLEGRKVVIMPVTNPDGMSYNTRVNTRGVDLNRNFAARNRENSSRNGYRALSEPEARAIHTVIHRYSPDRIISVHQPLACIDYDGPAAHLAKHLAEHCDLPVRKLGARSGSLGSYAGLTLRIPIITFELPRDADRLNREALWNRYGRAMLAGVVYPEKAK